MILLSQVQTLMDRFETQFENLDVQTQVMEGAMQDSSTLSTPQGEVDSLMQQVADEAGYVNFILLRHGDYGIGNLIPFFRQGKHKGFDCNIGKIVHFYFHLAYLTFLPVCLLLF